MTACLLVTAKEDLHLDKDFASQNYPTSAWNWEKNISILLKNNHQEMIK